MPDTLVPLLLVLAAAVLDVLANLLLARSEGFRRRLTGVLALLGVGLAFYCLSLAVRTLDLSVAYAMWGSFGILGTSLGGWLFFKQRLRPCAFAGIALLIAGMVLLHQA
ncbi:multidrug/spermidine efflux SMR transporter subunit MdtI [uncultured Desulfovibrio sp.]|uniref:multidrug/spermidine efflux SMR transporter subunit MdtI n=1 Tax=uncultured Desulfovibrio sp. TaxID=167968 RepID=UPI0026355333|nr:multidrug/spermidine efflux SMR transporter subunit MdtI [uncultured Desulfovibrio sp.]